MRDEWKGLGSFGTVGIEVVLSLLAGGYGGHWLDGRFGTGPWLTAVGLAYGCAAGGRALYRAWKDMQRIAAKEEREQGNPAPRFDPPETPPPSSRRPGDPPAPPGKEPDDEQR